jgi:hypothetical protein
MQLPGRILIQSFIILLGLTTVCKSRGLDSLFEMISDLDEENNQIVEFLEQLTSNPLDLNTISHSELETLPFLNHQQIDSIIFHRPYSKYSEVKKIIGIETYRLIKKFIILIKSKQKLKIQLTNRIQHTIEKNRGIKTGKFLGSSFESLSRLKLAYNPYITAGILIQKDPGERYLTDHLSTFLQFHNPHIGYRLIFGNFQIHSGQGLVFSSPYVISKSAYVKASIRTPINLKRSYLSANETDGFQGILADFTFKGRGHFLVYHSDQKKDGQLDSNGELYTDINRSGYHRTEYEIKTEERINEKSFGGLIFFNIHSKNQIGLSLQKTVYTPGIIFNQRTQSEQSLRRNRFHFSGHRVNVYSLYYSLTFNNFSVTGEIASNGWKCKAHQHGFVVNSPEWEFGVKYWYLPNKYDAPFGRSFGDSTPFPKSREGIYVGLSGKINSKLHINSYWTANKSLWRTYFNPMPIVSRDMLLQLNYIAYKRTDIIIRFQHSKKYFYPAKNLSTLNENRYKIRFQIIKTVKSNMRFRSQFEKVYILNSRIYPTKNGLNIYQDLLWDVSSLFRIQFRFSSFVSSDYESRIYEFENDLPGYFSNFPLYGRGYKWYLLLQYKVNKNINFWIKYRNIYYNDRESIGSGYTEISANHRQDIRFQFRLNY